MRKGIDDTKSNEPDDEPSSRPSSCIAEDHHVTRPAKGPNNPIVVHPEDTHPMIDTPMAMSGADVGSSLVDNSLMRSQHTEDPSLEATSWSLGTVGVTEMLAILDTDSEAPRPIFTHDPPSRLLSKKDPMRSSGGNGPMGESATDESAREDSGASSDESHDENTFVKVEQPKKAKKVKKKARAKVRPDPHGSSLSNEKSLRPHRKKSGISEEIVLVVPTPADRADAPPSGYMTLFENYFDQCLLWFPLPRFFMRFLAVHGVIPPINVDQERHGRYPLTGR
ncbi:hypothetical protein AALP_AA4G103800 [Arabis alpina]|uniref:Uncharacterized protein n=1 Tax=Arabis alpina TaxID=50452 RepID=A0A087H2E3_ARAAL|nr:hypothetical protein AALP_AA4G103800 [Arabis alpina]